MNRTEASTHPARQVLCRRRRIQVTVMGIAVLALATLLGGCGAANPTATTDSTVASSTSTNPSQNSSPIAASGLPQLIDLGSNSCVPCRMMAPELEALATEYKGSVEVVIVDVNTEEGAALAQQLSIMVIPTQIFVDPTGNELYRHEGYMSKEDMISVFEQMGYPLKRVGPMNPGTTQGGG